MEFNKIFAALLVAGIIAMVSGFVGDALVPLSDEAVHEAQAGDTSASGDTTPEAAPAEPAGPEPVLAYLADADIAKGKKLAKKCAGCHSFDKGGADKTGPNLYGIMGSPLAGKAGFKYSDALAAKGGNWDYDAMNQWLFKTKAFVPGTKMSFPGLKKVEDRAALIAYMRSMADSPIALPSVEDIAPEAGDEILPEEDAALDVEMDTEMNTEIPAGMAKEVQSIETQAGGDDTETDEQLEITLDVIDENDILVGTPVVHPEEALAE